MYVKNKILPFLLLASSGFVQAQDGVLRFDKTRSDLIFQMNFNQYSRNFIIGRAREVINELKGIDIFNNTLTLPKFNPYVHERGVADYIIGDLGQELARMIRGQIVGATTTFDVYRLNYRLGNPRAIVEIDQDSIDGLDFTVKIQMTNLRIGVDAIYVNNHSPGVVVNRYDGGEQERTHVVNPHLRTILDDIYLKIDNPNDRPMLIIDGGAKRRNDPIAVLSGKLKLRLESRDDGSLELKFRDFVVNLFGADDANQFAEYIDLQIGPDTKLGGLEALEIGRSNNVFRNYNLSHALEERKVMLAQLLAQPIIEQVFSEEIKQNLKTQIDGKVFKAGLEKELAGLGVNIKASMSEIGVINPNSSNHDDQLRLVLDLDLIDPTAKDFSYTSPYRVITKEQRKRSDQIIFEEINNDNYGFILSLDEEFLNRSINLMIRDKKKEVLEGKSPDYVSLGEKGAFLVLDEKPQGTVVMDMFARETFFKRMLMTVGTGRSKYFFPAVMTPEFVIEIRDDIPHLVLRIKDFDLSEETLRNGAYGLKSNLDKGWLKKVVLKYIRDEFEPAIGASLFEMPLPMLKGVSLDDVLAIKSDGNGRLNIMLDLSPRNVQARQLTYQLPQIIADLIRPKTNNGKK